MTLIAQLVEGQAKVIYDNCTREILEDTQYDRATRQSDANYVIHQASDRYKKNVRMPRARSAMAMGISVAVIASIVQCTGVHHDGAL